MLISQINYLFLDCVSRFAMQTLIFDNKCDVLPMKSTHVGYTRDIVGNFNDVRDFPCK